MCVGRSPYTTLLELPAEMKTEKIAENIKTTPKKTAEYTILSYKEDILAVSTYYTKIVCSKIGNFNNNFVHSNFYRFLFKTTQPAHLITAFSVLLIAYLMFPNTSKHHISPIWTLIYLGSFSAHFGAQIWMTFVSGLALYFSLPRHTFGNVQQILFPKYFLMNTALSLITLVIFLRKKNGEFGNNEVTVQAIAMSVCFLMELVVRLYLTPPLLFLMSKKLAIEIKAGIGMEVGKLDIGKLKNCPHYLKIHKKFRNVHMTIAILNVIAMACTTLHLHYLSDKLCVL